ncbi:MAG: CueP family metal-binding protein [Micrococcus sp.]|nr:CueP family metal-binding protein [Micrococcus sp.]
MKRSALTPLPTRRVAAALLAGLALTLGACSSPPAGEGGTATPGGTETPGATGTPGEVASTPGADPSAETQQPSEGEALTAEQMLAAHDLGGLEAREVVNRLDMMPVDERPRDFMASVRASTLVLTDDQQHSAELALPMGEFYLSFAPYERQTHECFFHSLTTCLGEMRNEEFAVNIFDKASGETLVEDNMTSYDNGFIGLWLPADRELTLVVITPEGKSAEQTISTAEDAPTCLTTLQLS